MTDAPHIPHGPHGQYVRIPMAFAAVVIGGLVTILIAVVAAAIKMRIDIENLTTKYEAGIQVIVANSDKKLDAAVQKNETRFSLHEFQLMDHQKNIDMLWAKMNGGNGKATAQNEQEIAEELP